jgi:hypothetical protein
VTRTALGTPEGPEDPWERFEAEFADTQRDCGFAPLVVPLTYKFSDGSGDRELTVLKSAHHGSTWANTVLTFDSNVFRLFAVEPKWYAADKDRKFVLRIETPLNEKPARRARLLIRKQYARVSPQKLTRLAVFIAGSKRAAVSTEWRSHLAGETGAGLSTDRQVRAAAGFVLAAIRYRIRDAANLAWRPVDAVLGSRALSSLFVLLVTLSFSLWLMRRVGVYGLAQCLESVLVVFGFAHGSILVGRWWTGVKPPEHKPRRRPKELTRLALTSVLATTPTGRTADLRRCPGNRPVRGLSTVSLLTRASVIGI